MNEKNVFEYVMTMYVDDMNYQQKLYELNCDHERIADVSAVNPYIETCTDNVISDMFETDVAIDYLWDVINFEKDLNLGSIYDAAKELDKNV